MTDTIELSLGTLNKVLGYLQEQKWKDANPLIQAVHAEVQPQFAAMKAAKEADSSDKGAD